MALVAAFCTTLAACDDKALDKKADGPPPPAGLTVEQASRPLAKVGDVTITLGDYAAALERMDEFDRLRYQTKERRRELLDQLIDVELLAAEANKRGLDKLPRTQEDVRQVLRDAVLSDLHDKLPPPAEIPEAEVRAYYEKHSDQFKEPERRRVSAIVMTDKAEAEKVLAEALEVKDALAWGRLFAKHSLNAPTSADPADLAGDMGIVGPPSDRRGMNPRVPEALRAAVFEIPAAGGVYGKLLEVEGKYFIVRLSGITAGHDRSIAESDRSIRVAILQEKMKAQEDALDADLRKRFPVEVNAAALAEVKVPSALNPPEPAPGSSSSAGSMEAPNAPSATANPAQ